MALETQNNLVCKQSFADTQISFHISNICLSRSFLYKMASYAEVLSGLRKAFSSGKTKSVEWRKQQLKGLMRMYEENEGLFTDALHKDLHKPKWEASMAEVEMNKNDIRGNVINQIHRV